VATVGSPGAETGLICLFGSPGSGKTVLLQEVAAALGAAGHVVMVQPGMVQPGGRPVAGSVILHDDAGWLADDALVRLARQPFPSIVAGPRELADRLLALPVGVRLVELLPVEAEDIPALVADLLGQAGLSPSMLLPEAVAALAERSGGLPRPLRLIQHPACVTPSRLATRRARARGPRRCRSPSRRMDAGRSWPWRLRCCSWQGPPRFGAPACRSSRSTARWRR
jgi:hypothetical protein